MRKNSIYADFDPKSKVVLIVDDNPTNLKVLGKMLETIGFRIRVSRSGEECISSIKITKPDIILLDIHMPGMDGYEVCQVLKSSNEFDDIPIIFISALSEEFNKVQGFEFGGVDYITKPFELKDVELRIKTHLLLVERTNKLKKAIEELEFNKDASTNSKVGEGDQTLTIRLAKDTSCSLSNAIDSLNSWQQKIEEMDGLLKFLPESLETENIIEILNEIRNSYENVSKEFRHFNDILKKER